MQKMSGKKQTLEDSNVASESDKRVALKQKQLS